MTTDTPILTTREIQILTFIRQGMTNKQIALLLGIQPVTVEYHLGKVFRKLNASTRTEAVVLAEKMGLLPPMEIHSRQAGLKMLD